MVECPYGINCYNPRHLKTVVRRLVRDLEKGYVERSTWRHVLNILELFGFTDDELYHKVESKAWG